jgi:hypothetical protein
MFFFGSALRRAALLAAVDEIGNKKVTGATGDINIGEEKHKKFNETRISSALDRESLDQSESLIYRSKAMCGRWSMVWR